ncbi:MAG: carboxypeptidase regulatory-like domain-containing protein [Ardenticatenaceae bacterium]|nr:carboxypeptidase regulatory-like domain-containing protein [Anaerolineales bacterium]MCB8920704.1 carboxypeptidase regulatory-like domain-containing protein [Ardenticatenaceae bacterium]MCB8989663.1 carboxypeptidase regulatory-like domain-containing protein [Ardenticatenaceae bacterium]MCB9002878.1 carboxypeptidase regulatory-like domain-containing protein [Ardenticatenaceae bacterium]
MKLRAVGLFLLGLAVVLFWGGARLFSAAGEYGRFPDTDVLLRVSQGYMGGEADGDSQIPVMARDGRFLTYTSLATNLVPDDANNQQDVFVYDVEGESTTLVSRATDGTQGNGAAENPDISGDGRFVVFESTATNLVTDDSNNQRDIFLHDRSSGTTTLLSLTHDGELANGDSANAAIAADGGFVAFESLARNLVISDTNLMNNIFVRDLTTDAIALISVGAGGEPANGMSFSPELSADGRYITFYANATNLVANDTTPNFDIFLHDRQTGDTVRVSQDAQGGEASGDSFLPVISDDGRFIAYISIADNLVSGDTNNSFDVFVYDRTTGQNQLISRTTAGLIGNGDSFIPTLSADGRTITFFSAATNLVADDTNGAWDVFLHDLQTGETRLISQNLDGLTANGNSAFPSVSGDGALLAFDSFASDLVVADTNERQDIFLILLDHSSAVYLPLVARPAVYEISGEVRDSGGAPLSGVTIRTDTGVTAVTNASGIYQFSGLFARSYTLTPSLAGYVFTPASRTVTLPPDALNVNFTAALIPTATPTSTPRPAPTATPTATPNPCHEQVNNGGFEQTEFWTIGQNAYPAAYDTAVVHNGSRAMRVGIFNPGDNTNSYSSVWQTVAIPANATSATFTFWLYTGSSGTRMTLPAEDAPIIDRAPLIDDAQYVLIYDQNEQQHTLIFQRLNELTWTYHQFDLSQFAGQNVRLYFGTYNNGYGGITGIYVDDVSLQTCTP